MVNGEAARVAALLGLADLVGAALAALGLSRLAFAVVQAPARGWPDREDHEHDARALRLSSP
jgi:hypothetical protein